jgi:hypothetical protein
MSSVLAHCYAERELCNPSFRERLALPLLSELQGLLMLLKEKMSAQNVAVTSMQVSVRTEQSEQ